MRSHSRADMLYRLVHVGVYEVTQQGRHVVQTGGKMVSQHHTAEQTRYLGLCKFGFMKSYNRATLYRLDFVWVYEVRKWSLHAVEVGTSGRL